MCSVGTSPIKPGQEEQSLTPPGKTQTVGTRSPNCGRQQHTVRAKALPNTAGTGSNHKHEYEVYQSLQHFECLVRMMHRTWPPLHHWQTCHSILDSGQGCSYVLISLVLSPQVVGIYHGLCWFLAVMVMGVCLLFRRHCHLTAHVTYGCFLPIRRRSWPSASSWTRSV